MNDLVHSEQVYHSFFIGALFCCSLVLTDETKDFSGFTVLSLILKNLGNYCFPKKLNSFKNNLVFVSPLSLPHYLLLNVCWNYQIVDNIHLLSYCSYQLNSCLNVSRIWLCTKHKTLHFYLSDKVSCDSLHVRVVSSWVSVSVSASGSTSSVFIKSIAHLEHIEN